VPATTAFAIIDIIADSAPGELIEVEVMRDQQRFRASAIAGELPDPE
jgi:hypothetical protein